MAFQAVLLRIASDMKSTRGNLFFYEGNSKIYRACVLELPWKDNKPRVSCIPEGVYPVTKIANHPKYGNCFLLHEVPGRSEVMIHPGNYTKQILGCLLPGDAFRDIDKDGALDVTNSKPTLNMLYKLAPNSFTLKITHAW